jgi:hypothetical protein
MKGFLAVFERELAERRLLAAMALGFGVVAVVLPLLPGFQKSGSTVAELRGGLAFALASDLVERRLGFYFARPLSGWALWSGKIVAAVVLTFGTGLLALLPALLLGGDISLAGYWSLDTMGQPEGFFNVAVGLLFLLFAANAVSVMVRSRSPWIAADMGALILVWAVLWSAWYRLILAGVDLSRKQLGVDSMAWAENVWVWGPLAALAAAGAAQVLLGRTDLRRAHRALSATLWSLLLALGIASQVFTWWMVSAGPEDLAGVTQAVTAPTGSSSWIAITGPAMNRSGYNPGFLYDVDSGRVVRAGFGLTARWWEAPVRISADGRRAVWLEYQERPFSSPLVLHRLDLDRPGARPLATSISYGGIYQGMPKGFALSPDGRRVAAIQDDRLTVDDVETGRLLASVPLTGELWSSRLAFVGPNRIRMYQFAARPSTPKPPVTPLDYDFDISELDLATGKMATTGRLSKVQGVVGILSPDGSRIILRTRDQLQLHDARTGEPLGVLGASKKAAASFLSGGRIAVTNPPAVGGARELRVLAPDGVTELRRFRFENTKELIPVDQPSPGSLRIVTSSTGDPGSPWEVRLLDLETGGVQSQGTRELAALVPPDDDHETRISFEGKQGVVWTEMSTLRRRVILKDS